MDEVFVPLAVNVWLAQVDCHIAPLHDNAAPLDGLEQGLGIKGIGRG